jgi:hypothetical protein
VGVVVLRAKKEMEVAVEAEGVAFRMEAGAQTTMKEVPAELLVMDLVPAMVVIKGIMFLLMEFFEPDREGNIPAAAIGIITGITIVQMLVGITVTMVTIMLDVLFQLATQVIWLAMGMVGMLPMFQA